MKALTVISFVAVALVTVAGPAAAQVQLVQVPLVNDADRAFVNKAVSGGVAEVEFGRIAVQRAARPSVRSFAERMITDHGRGNAELATLARTKGIDVPTTLEPSDQAMRDRLSGLSGADFDRAYMSDIVRDHTEDVALFERAAEISADPDIRAWAARSLPMLRDHLTLARQVNSEVVLGPVPAPVPAPIPAALPAAAIVPWCEGVYAPAAGTNFGGCAPLKQP
jgi:putative membrane protein